MGFLWDPCGIFNGVGKKFFFQVIVSRTWFPDPNCFPLRPFATSWLGKERLGNNYLGKTLFPKSHQHTTRIPQGSHKDSANSQQEPYKDKNPARSACKVLVGNLWNPCGIIVGSLWDPCGIFMGFGKQFLSQMIVSRTWFPDPNCFPSAAFATSWLGKERLGNNYLGKKLFPKSHQHTTRIPTRIPQGFRKFPTRTLQGQKPCKKSL